MRYLPFILLFALIVYALVDCIRYDDASMPAGMPKALWVVLIVVFPAAGTYIFELHVDEQSYPLTPLHIVENPDAA